MSEEFPQGMPTLSRAEDETSISEERVKEILKPYEAALLSISSDEAKKSWLKSKETNLSEEELNEKHIKLTSYAEEQTKALGLQGEITDLLKTYYYVHGLVRYFS